MIDETLIYGFHPVREALRSRPQTVARVWVSLRPGAERRSRLEDLCRRHRVPLVEVPESQLREKAGDRHHNGIGAWVRAVCAQSFGTVGDPALAVLAEDVQDPRNLGALLRVCEGAGVGKVFIRDRGSAPLSPVVAKTSAGASGWLDIERIPNTARLIRQLQAEGFWIYGADLDGESIWEIDLTGKVLLCLGGEEKGLRAHTRKICDRLVGLPMRGRIESLNLATAAAALLYEAVRQRESGNPLRFGADQSLQGKGESR